MYIDICLPNNNEKELIKRAKELGYSQLVFLYQFKSVKAIQEKKKLFPEQKIGLVLFPKKAFGITKLPLKLACEADLVAAASADINVIRAILGHKNIDIAFNVPNDWGRDNPHYRYSNFNQVFANIAKKNDTIYCINFSRLSEKEGKDRAKLLGREMQNIRICRRKIPIIMASFAKNEWQMRKPEDFSSILQLMGLNEKQAKNGLSKHIENILKHKETITKRGYIRKGVKVID